MSRTIVIGDLHGCFDETEELLSQLQVTSSDRLIFAGDLVDRGPKPAACVDLAMKYECVLGNHEEKHLQQRRRLARQRALGDMTGLNEDHVRTFEAMTDAHYAYFESLPLFIRLPEFNALVVHAGVFPGIPVETQSPHHLMHIQHINPPATKSHWPSKAPADAKFWTNFYTGPERVIFGHSVLDQPLVTPWAVGIDTGAVFGRGLTALVLPEWKIVTLPTRDYSSGRKTLAQYDIQDGVKAFS